MPERVGSGGVQAASVGPLRVAYVLKMFPRFSETFILREILELERRGVRVVIFSMKVPNEPLRQPDVSRVKGHVHVIPRFAGAGILTHLVSHLACLLRAPVRYLRTLFFAARRGSRAAGYKFLVAPYIVRRARALGVEHFHAHFASGPARQAKLASLLSGIPFSFTAHAKDIFWTGHNHGKNNKLKKRVRLASFVVTISEYNREFIQSLGFKVPRGRLVTIYNGLHLERWPHTRPDGQPCNGSANDVPVLLAVGRLVPKKGFDVLVAACARLRDRGVSFRCLLAGEGPEEAHLADLIARKDLQDVVELLGPVPQDELVQQLYPRAAVLLQPSVVGADGDRDGIPTVILEAMALGLPVIATPVSGIAEAVQDRESGLLVPPGDPEALASAVQEILTDRALVLRLAVGARRRVETCFNLKNNSKLLVNLMESAAGKRRRYSQKKLRERVGLDPLEEPLTETKPCGTGDQG